MTTGGRVPDLGSPPPRAPRTPAGSEGLDAVLDSPDKIPNWIRDAAAELPERRGDKGPTHGLLYDVNGRGVTGTPLTKASGFLRSGQVPVAREGLRADWYSGAQATREHVEAHAAAMLRKPGTPDEAVLVVNKRTCRSRGNYVGCDEVLPGMLPQGKRLAIYVTDGHRTRLLTTYEGTGEGIEP